MALKSVKGNLYNDKREIFLAIFSIHELTSIWPVIYTKFFFVCFITQFIWTSQIVCTCITKLYFTAAGMFDDVPCTCTCTLGYQKRPSNFADV